jgi:hypothetical protein
MPSTLTSEVLTSLTPDNAFSFGLPWWGATAEQTAEAVALLAPYRQVAENWHRTNHYSDTGLMGDADLQRMLTADPYAFPSSLPRLMTYLRGRTGAETIERKPDSREGQAAALAVMRRREAQAIADREAAERRIAELEARVVTPVAPTVAAWGPDHPDWIPFWHQAAIDAERAGNCGEYDRHAEEMSAPSRYWFRSHGYSLETPDQCYDYSVSVRVSAWITVGVHGTEVSMSEVRDALDDMDLGDAIASNGYDVTDYNVDDQRTCDDCESGSSVWSNPDPTRY